VIDEVEKAHAKLSKDARDGFEDLRRAPRSAENLRDAPSEEDFNRRFSELPPNQQRYLRPAPRRARIAPERLRGVFEGCRLAVW
jgi:hypothetical protein